MSGGGPRNIALFGGSFDPPHFGHLYAALWAMSRHELESLIVMPTADHAFAKELSPFEHRFEMCLRAFSTLRNASVSDLEGRRGGKSYTIDTIRELAKEHPDATLHFIVGEDVADQLDRWRESERLQQLAKPLVVRRGERDDPFSVYISSTEIRRMLAAAELDAEALALRLPTSVTAYARAHNLYRETP